MPRKDDRQKASGEELLSSIPLTFETCAPDDLLRKDMVAPIVLPKYTKADIFTDKRATFHLPPNRIQGQVSVRPQLTLDMPDLRMTANLLKELREKTSPLRSETSQDDNSFDADGLVKRLAELTSVAILVLEESRTLSGNDLDFLAFQDVMLQEVSRVGVFKEHVEYLSRKVFEYWNLRKEDSKDSPHSSTRVHELASCPSANEKYCLPFIRREGVDFSKLLLVTPSLTVEKCRDTFERDSIKKTLFHSFVQNMKKVKDFLMLIDLRELKKEETTLGEMYILAKERL